MIFVLFACEGVRGSARDMLRESAKACEGVRGRARCARDCGACARACEGFHVRGRARECEITFLQFFNVFFSYFVIIAQILS